MTEQEDKDDKFWFYVGGLAASLIIVLVLIKSSENEKFDHIKDQLDEEIQSMNIRVLN